MTWKLEEESLRKTKGKWVIQVAYTREEKTTYWRKKFPAEILQSSPKSALVSLISGQLRLLSISVRGWIRSSECLACVECIQWLRTRQLLLARIWGSGWLIYALQARGHCSKQGREHCSKHNPESSSHSGYLRRKRGTDLAGQKEKYLRDNQTHQAHWDRRKGL